MFDDIINVIKSKTNQMFYYYCEYTETEPVAIPDGITEEEYNTLIEALNELIDASMSAGRMY